MKIRQNNAIGELAGAIGKGLIAGVAATAAMTLSQLIEMKITKRKPSEATIKVASETTGIKPANEAEKQKVSQEIHWSYGTAWGVARGIIGLTGIKGLPAALLHFATVWGAALVMLPSFDAAPPITEEEPNAVAVDALHHAIYALTAGVVYDALDAGSKNERKLNKLIDQLKLRGMIKNID